MMTDKKKGTRSNKRGKRTPPNSEACSPSPSPSPQEEREKSPQSPRRISQASSPSTSRDSSRSHSPSTQPQKKAKTITDLTAAQEDDMASWLEANELMYNKKINAYKDCRKKDALWESKAADMNKDVAILTERDRWILQNFAWLKTTVSLKEKIAGAASVEVVDVDDGQSEASTVREDTPTETTSRQRLEPLSRRSSASTKKANQEEERLLSDIVTRGEQSTAFQTKVLEMLAPPKTTERTAYAVYGIRRIPAGCRAR